jgi:hypothetical protein
VESTEPPASIPPPKSIGEPKVAETSAAVGETSAADKSSPAVNLDLTKITDAKRVQQRLIELGYLFGVADGVWGSNSRRALSEFRKAERLGQDDLWDQATEKKMFSTSAAKQQSLAFVGGWSKDASSCADASIKITGNRAMSRDAVCDFNSIRQEGEGKWRVQAHCELASGLRTADTENAWTASIKLTLDDRRLTWESEKGVEGYYRCSQ